MRGDVTEPTEGADGVPDENAERPVGKWRPVLWPAAVGVVMVFLLPTAVAIVAGIVVPMIARALGR